MKVFYEPEIEKVVKLDERFEVIDPTTSLGMRVFLGRVYLLGYDTVTAEYSEFGFSLQKKNLSLELLERFLQIYYDARKSNEPISKG